MTSFTPDNVKWTNRLKEAFGETVELEDEQGVSSIYRIAAEFEVEGQGYVVLQGEGKDEEPDVLKFSLSPGGIPELETIDDDDEWEEVSELYDELTFPEEEDGI
ncbi:DUF1292 domain-containing protein [Paenibacillus spiritus]|uniref:DUF1292 domain-containing protein n=1 Tax=Paenibacillus spiritus TaxID=2496557 RepID=A0A5J5GBX1_9BACL|nr:MULTISPECIES: DUF1292 domain-containing protein [Paenibacillus]KAA9005393.1 DUF1292 domain-containing protein [Paenibacillus spiritus]